MNKILLGIVIIIVALVIVFSFWLWLRPVSSEEMKLRNDKLENTGLDKVPTDLPGLPCNMPECNPNAKL